MKVCRKKPKQRAFFLFNDILVYGRVVINGRKVKNIDLIKRTFHCYPNEYIHLVFSTKNYSIE